MVGDLLMRLLGLTALVDEIKADDQVDGDSTKPLAAPAWRNRRPGGKSGAA